MDLEQLEKLGVDFSKEAFAKSRALDRELKQERKDAERYVRLLMLGCGDSGKTTFSKQLELNYYKEPDATELSVYIDILRDNSLTAMHTFLKVCSNIGYAIPSSLEEHVEIVEDCTYLDAEAAESITAIWKDTEIQELWKNRASAIHLASNAEYFFKNVQRFAADDYKPSEEDMLRARARTTGVIESKFEDSGFQYTLIDVGGQRNERRKWIHLFDNVTAVVFMAALDEYDMVLEEASDYNRMQESLKLFEEITSNRAFEKTQFVLLLNKFDLFQNKVEERRIPLQTTFPDYEGTANAEEAMQFIKAKYQLNYRAKGELVIHATCVLDKEVCLGVFGAIRGLLVRHSQPSQ